MCYTDSESINAHPRQQVTEIFRFIGEGMFFSSDVLSSGFKCVRQKYSVFASSQIISNFNIEVIFFQHSVTA